MIVYSWGGSYNKRDSSYRWGGCESCGRVGHLHNYSATKFFSIYWVPLIPHGNHRVLRQCPSCKMGRAIGVGEWKKLRRDALLPAVDALRRSPNDREAAEVALGHVVELGEKEEFEAVASRIAQEFPRDAELLARLGGGYADFGAVEDARQLFERSLQVEESEEVRGALDFVTAHPPTPSPAPPGRGAQMLPLLVLPGIVVAVLVFALFWLASARPHVFVVNGLDVPYAVLVNGGEIQIPALAHRELDVDFGTTTVAAVPGGLPVAGEELELEGSFFGRRASTLFVLNPDRTAILTLNQAVYVPEGEAAGEGRFECHTGKSFYRFEDIEYPFRPAPDSISTRSSSGEFRRWSLEQLTHGTAQHRAGFVMQVIGQDAAGDFAERTLALNPADEDLLPFVSAFAAPEGALELIRPRLKQRPCLIEWHRYYQEITKRAHPEQDLAAEYRELLEADEDNSALAYLAGRVAEEPDVALGLFERATQGPSPEPYAHHALAFGYSERADYPRALESARVAVALQPDKLPFRELEDELLLAVGDWDELVSRRREDFAQNPHDQRVALSLVSVLSGAGAGSEVRATIEQHVTGLREMGDPALTEGEVAGIQSSLEATAGLWSGDVDAFLAVAGVLPESAWGLSVALAEGDAPRAARFLAEDQNAQPDAYAHLGLYALAASAGESEVAEVQLASAIEILAGGSRDDRELASWFASGAAAPSVEGTLVVTLPPVQRRLAVLALGVRHEDVRDDMFDCAARLNFMRNAWFYVVPRVVGR